MDPQCSLTVNWWAKHGFLCFGCFGGSGLQEKKSHSCMLLRVVFYVFVNKMNKENRLSVHCGVCTKKLNIIKVKKM